jgi:serine/threonine-protein kinase
VVGYECLTGAPPFRGAPVEVAVAHRHRSLPPLPPDVPAGVAALIGELTAKDPAARPASAGAVAERAGWLRDALASGTTAVLPAAPPGAIWADAEPVTLIGLPAPSAAPARRGRGVLLAVGGAVVAAGLAVWLLPAAFGGAAPQHPPGVPHAVRTPATPAAQHEHGHGQQPGHGHGEGHDHGHGHGGDHGGNGQGDSNGGD